ncbi:MAG TPA: S-methyl-5'-thioadenosine phosphorylase [Limnochordia bacterium]
MIAVIGGTGVGDALRLDAAVAERVETPYGPCAVIRGRLGARPVLFLPRHGTGHALPPHRINYRANLWGLCALGADQILATAAVGSLNPAMRPGECVVVDQFLDFTKSRPLTFYDERPVHTDMTDPYCSALRSALVAAAGAVGAAVHREGCYACTEGPRYESRAEIRALQRLGADVVGMTGIPEVILARELGLCYACLAVVTNWAAGMASGPLSHEDVARVMAERMEQLPAILALAAEGLADRKERECGCPPRQG